MVLFVMDYQTVNVVCREEIRKALPVDTTVFFERIPTDEVFEKPPYGAFTQACQCAKWWSMKTKRIARNGFIIRQIPRSSIRAKDGTDVQAGPITFSDNKTYLADTAAQLLVVDDFLEVEGPKGACMSKCSAYIPEEECILVGFC